MKIKSPFLDNKGDPSWTVFVLIWTIVIITVALCLVWFAPEWISERVYETKTFLRDAFFAIIVGYITRRWTRIKEVNGTPKVEEIAEKP